MAELRLYVVHLFSYAENETRQFELESKQTKCPPVFYLFILLSKLLSKDRTCVSNFNLLTLKFAQPTSRKPWIFSTINSEFIN